MFLLVVFVILRPNPRPGPMSNHPYQTYPHHHPHHGRPYIVVHNHDVLCGRGVNIAQHPGNERFRALVNTRHDESYCTTFTTSEKRALAEEIIKHIRALKPPGRFLKRTGRSQSSRGLNGPWEELTYRECVKKTCQALRDCNRTDRQGYAAQVSVPPDVKDSAKEREKSGLSLKEHAAAAVSKTNPTTLHPHHVNLNPPPLDHYQHPGAVAMANAAHPSLKRPANQVLTTTSTERVSPSAENAAEWLKRQRIDDPLPPGGNSHQHSDEYVSSSYSGVHSTPAPHVAPVPVTNTPGAQQYAQLPHHDHDHTDPYPLSHHTTSPQMPSPTSYHQDHHEMTTSVSCPAPYPPVALLTPQGREEHTDGSQDLESSNFPDHQASYSNQMESLHYHTDLNHPPSADYVLQSAADAAAAFINNPSNEGFSLVGGDEVPHESLDHLG